MDQKSYDKMAVWLIGIYLVVYGMFIDRLATRIYDVLTGAC